MSVGDTPAPSLDWESLARGAARSGDEEGEGQLLRELLAFRLDGSPYAIPVERVREIVRLRDITPVPMLPAWVLGVVALRGEVVQVVDLRMCLGLATREATRKSRIIVLHGDDERVTGILVDAVEQVLRIEEESIRPSVATDSGAVNELCMRDDEFVSIVDMDRVLELRAD
jgi:purine-binding chemotaxis protein CheW